MAEGHEAFGYEALLKMVVDIVTVKNADTEDAVGFKLDQPKCSMTRVKSTWHNFGLVSENLNRKSGHILEFFTSELGCEGNLGVANEMVLTGKFRDKHFTKLIKKYIQEYVMCIQCRSYNTLLEKEDKTRMWVVKCCNCKSARTVANIASRFVATRRGDKKKARQAGLI